MKFRLTTLALLAAIVAVPSVASAASIHGNAMQQKSASVPGTPNVTLDYDLMSSLLFAPSGKSIVPQNSDPAQALASADSTYLLSMCPTVMAHPGDHTALLNRFCQVKRS